MKRISHVNVYWILTNKHIRVWLWIVYKFTENNCRSRLSTKLERDISRALQNKYSNLNTTFHTKPTFFFRIKPLKNVLQANFLIPVTTAWETTFTPTLIRRCKISWWCSPFLDQKYPLLHTIIHKIFCKNFSTTSFVYIFPLKAW